VGLAQDLFVGAVKHKYGVPIKVKMMPPDPTAWTRSVYRSIKSLGAALTYPIMTDDEEVYTWFAASTFGFQYLHDAVKDWHPCDMVDDIPNLQIHAPIPEDPLTLEVIEEEGIPLQDVVGWPQTNEKWSTFEELADVTRWGVAENLERFVLRNKHSFLGLAGAMTSIESSRFALATIESEAEVDTDFTPAVKIATKMLESSYSLRPDQSLALRQGFALYLHHCNFTAYNPSMNEIQSYCSGPAGIELQQF